MEGHRQLRPVRRSRRDALITPLKGLQPDSSRGASQHPDLTLEDRNRFRKVVSGDAVAEHDFFAGVRGQVFD